MPSSSATDPKRTAQAAGKAATKGGTRFASSPAAITAPVVIDPPVPALSVKGLGKTYSGSDGATRVLDDVSFAIMPGEAVAIVGSNGSGKSTALRCALRLIEPSEGEVALNGQPLMRLGGADLRRCRAKVGFIFQKHNLITRLSVLSNVMHGALARGLGIRAWSHGFAPKVERERALSCLDQVGLADLAGRRADRLSGGQSQRVAIARALMQDPAMLFADEPAASLDPKAGDDVMDLFSDLRLRTGLTLVFVSHNLEHALAHAERLIGLQAGKVVLDGPCGGTTRPELAWLYGAEPVKVEPRARP